MSGAIQIWLSPTLYQPVGRQFATSWTRLAARFQDARSAPSKLTLARWAPVEFRDAKRCLANVVHAYAVVLDVDSGSELPPILGALAGLFAIAHSTFSATPQCPRWRVVVPLDRSVDAEEYERVWRWLTIKLEASGVTPDYAAKDASRAWAVPARPPSGFYVVRVIEGAFASVDEALVAIPKPEPPPEHDRSMSREGSYADRFDRARKYIEKMPGAISGSGGHLATFKAASVLVRGFELAPDDALALLLEVHNPLCTPKWSPRELRHKVKQASQRGRLPFGWISDRDRESVASWRPTNFRAIQRRREAT